MSPSLSLPCTVACPRNPDRLTVALVRRSLSRSSVRPAPIRSIFVTRDHAITRVACRDSERGSVRACFQSDSPQPTVAPCPPPRSSTTLHNPEQGWPGASAALGARITTFLPSRRVLVSRFRRDRDLLYHFLSFRPAGARTCFQPGPEEQVTLPYNLSGGKNNNLPLKHSSV